MLYRDKDALPSRISNFLHVSPIRAVYCAFTFILRACAYFLDFYRLNRQYTTSLFGLIAAGSRKGTWMKLD